MSEHEHFSFWREIAIQSFAAVLVIVPLLLAYLGELRKARSAAQFVIDQFDYTIAWATGFLALEQTAPNELSSLLLEYFGRLRETVGADSLRLHNALPVRAGEAGEAGDPWKLLHLAFASIEARIGQQELDPNVLLAGQMLSHYLSLLLGMGDKSARVERMKTLNRGLKSNRSEILELLNMLVRAGPKELADKIASS